MNLMLDPNLWYGGGYHPPIYWNPSEQRYEILVESQSGENGILLELNVGAVQGDTIDFDYEIDGFIDASTAPDFVGIQSDLGDFIWTLPVEELPATGSVSVECEAGRRYSIGLYRDGGFGFSLYAFEAIITPTPEPPELVANDDEATTPMNTPVTVPVLANDTLGDEPVALEDLAGPPTIVTQPPVGTATANPDGTITYTPPEGFTGEVEFQYRIASSESSGCIEAALQESEETIYINGLIEGLYSGASIYIDSPVNQGGTYEILSPDRSSVTHPNFQYTPAGEYLGVELTTEGGVIACVDLTVENLE